MKHSSPSPSLLAVSLVSVALHAALALGLQTGAHAARPPRHEPIRVTVRETPRAAVPPSVEKEQAQLVPPVPAASATPAEHQRVKPARHMAPRTPTASTSAAPEDSAAAAPSALDFTGVTLSSPHGALVQAAGNGEHREGPLGPVAGGSGRGSFGAGTGQGKGAAQAAPLVALGSLSRPPAAPLLDQALAANYPRPAHDLGLSGEAVVRARILSDGQVGPTAVLVASSPEFGRACQRTLAGSRWSAPLDARGRPVATELRYKCVFEVTR